MGRVDLDGSARACAFSTTELLAHLLGQACRGLEGGGLLGRAQRLRIGRRHGLAQVAKQRQHLVPRGDERRVLLVVEESARSLDALRRRRELRRVVAHRKVLLVRKFVCRRVGKKVNKGLVVTQRYNV